MAKGYERVEQAAAEAQERQRQWREQNKPQLWPKDGEAFILRFLEQGPDVHNYRQHEYFAQTSKGAQRRYFTCLNDNEDGTPCPGCSEGLKTRIRVVYNVIQRQRPIFRKGQDGKAMRDGNNNFIVEGYADEVVIFEVPNTSGNIFRQMDAEAGGLMSRDFKVSKTGTQFSPYVIVAADMNSGAVPMSEADQQLAQGRHDLDEFMKPPSFEEAAKLAMMKGSGQQQQAQPSAPVQGQPVVDDNPFLPGANQPQPQS